MLLTCPSKSSTLPMPLPYFLMKDDRLNLTQGVQVILKMKSMNFRKIYDIYESKKKYMKYMNISVQANRGFIFCLRHAGLTASEPQRASARRDDHQRPTIRPEECLPQAQILENMYLSLVSMHLSIINCCFYLFWPILSNF